MLTRATRNVTRMKLLLAVSILALFLTGQARADFHLTLVIAVDLSKSVAVQGADQQTEFEKNVAAVTRLLAQVPAGATVTVIGITDHSFAQADAASIPGDPGYFGERPNAARETLVRAWQHRSARLEPPFPRTDILGMLLLASQLFDEHRDTGPQELIIFSDMRQNTSDLELESPASVPRIPPKNKDAKITGVQLPGVQVCILAADGLGRSVAYWQSLRQFWTRYFREAGAKLDCYSVLRERPECWVTAHPYST
jgi:hypothetical protein